MKKHPLVAVALLYIVGIIVADNVSISPWWLGGAWAVTLVAAILIPRARQYLLAAGVLLAGAAIFAVNTEIIAPQDIRSLVDTVPQIATVRGCLTETPYQRFYERNQRTSWRSMAFLEMDSMSLGRGTTQPACGKLAVSTPGILPSNLYAGQMVEVSGVIQLPNGPVVEGMFDYRKHLRRLGIHYQLQAGSSNDWKAVPPAAAVPFSDRFISWAQKSLARGLPEIDEPVRLLWAMTLGWKTGLSGEVSEPFMRSGTMHVFAISGLHIALIALMIVGLLRCCNVPRATCCFVVIPLIWIYTGITGWQASAIRSTIMTSVIVFGWSLVRPSNIINSLAAAAVIILVWDPQQFFQAGFQLSFLVVFSLAMISPILSCWKDHILKPDAFLPDSLRSTLELRARWMVNGVLTASVTSLAAWLGSIPVVAAYFHYLTPSSLVANLLVVPLSSFALASNLASLATVSWFPQCAELFNHAAWCFMRWMVQVSEWSADLPCGCFNVSAPGPATFLLYYVLLITILGALQTMAYNAGSAPRPWWCREPAEPAASRRLLHKLWFAAGAAFLLLVSLWTIERQKEERISRLTILPLQGGEAIHARHHGGTLLIDGGNEDAAKFTTKAYLRAQGINQLPAMLLTHGDVRQMGGATMLQQIFSCPQVYASALRFRSLPYRKTIETFEKSPKLLHAIKKGDQVGPWLILHPAENYPFKQADDATIVAFANMDGVRILLLSDLGRAGQATLLACNPDLRAEIVVAGLPGGAEPLGEPLLDAVKPRTVIITDARYPGNEHANRRLRDRLSRHEFEVWYTSDVGAINVLFESGRWAIHSALPRQPLPPGTISEPEDEAEPIEPE